MVWTYFWNTSTIWLFTCARHIPGIRRCPYLWLWCIELWVPNPLHDRCLVSHHEPVETGHPESKQKCRLIVFFFFFFMLVLLRRTLLDHHLWSIFQSSLMQYIHLQFPASPLWYCVNKFKFDNCLLSFNGDKCTVKKWHLQMFWLFDNCNPC